MLRTPFQFLMYSERSQKMTGVQFFRPNDHSQPFLVIITDPLENSPVQVLHFATWDHLGPCIASRTERWKGLTIPLIYCHFCALAEVQNELKNSSAFLIP